MWDQLQAILKTKDKPHLLAELNSLSNSEIWKIVQLFLEARAEEAKFNLYANVQHSQRHNEAAFEAGRELALLYASKNLMDDLNKYLQEGTPVVEHPRPDEE